MIPGLTSIIIPVYNQAAYLTEAVASARAQTADVGQVYGVEVIIVDDGSTDHTDAVVRELHQQYGTGLFSFRRDHQGVSAARNFGIDMAGGEFLMFLDADDVIAPNKVERQLQAMNEETGWVLCDVRIEDEVRRKTENASDRYGYTKRELGGWIREQLAVANFIPIMSPLFRRALLDPEGDTPLRFGERQPEDWHFWYGVAGRGRVRYVPEVLATYRKRRGSRSTLGLPTQKPTDGPLLLNLGCGAPGALSWHPMPGCVNLDKALGWYFEDGLPQYRDNTVDGITVSHACMYIHDDDWPRVFAEFARVLKPGGIIRITEDDTINPASSRHGGWKGSEPAICQTSADKVKRALWRVGLRATDVNEDESKLPALRQAQHGAPPHVFFVEGVKP